MKVIGRKTRSLDGWKRAALYAFTDAMEAQLSRPENAVKETWEGAELEDVPRLMNEVWYHAAKLQKALEVWEAKRNDPQGPMTDHEQREHAILEFACDVANCALIVADVAEVLKHSEDDAVGDNGEKVISWRGYP